MKTWTSVESLLISGYSKVYREHDNMSDVLLMHFLSGSPCDDYDECLIFFFHVFNACINVCFLLLLRLSLCVCIKTLILFEFTFSLTF